MRASTGRAMRRFGVQGLALAVVFSSGLWVSNRYDVSVARAETEEVGEGAIVYQPTYRRSVGPQLALLFVGSSTCPWSTDPDLVPVLEALKRQLADYSESRGLGFRALAVSVDWVPERGLDYLASLGAFDEIAVGGNWANSVLLDHVWERGASVVTPAVFLYYRELVQEADSALLAGMERRDEKLLTFRNGLQEIRALVDLGPERFLAGSGPPISPPISGEDKRQPREEGRHVGLR